MKNLIKFILIFICFQKSYTQIFYTNYLDLTSEWRILNIYNDTGYHYCKYSTRFLNGQENINGFAYYKMYETSNYTLYDFAYSSVLQSQSTPNTNFFGYLREDSSGKFYFGNYSQNGGVFIEQVWFDNQEIINKALGDNYFLSNNIGCPIDYISTVNIVGDNRKVLFSNTNFLNGGSAIEGIGYISRYCLDQPIVDLFDSDRIICYSKQGQTTSLFVNYTLGLNGIFSLNCNSFPAANHQGLETTSFSAGNVFIYPNPTKNDITIVGMLNDSENIIQLIDLQGRVLVEKKSQSMQLQLDLSTFQSGYYFVKIGNQEGQKIVKILKE